MADFGALPSPPKKFKRPTSHFFNSPRLFTNFASKPFFEPESAPMSPTSILDTKPFSGFKNSPKTPKTLEPTEPHKRNWEKSDSKVGLGIVDSFTDEKPDPKIPSPETRMVLFGSQLKIQIPPLPPSVLSPANSPESSVNVFTNEVGSVLLGSSPSVKKPESGPQSPDRIITGGLTAREMELSEDYTCVIAHGPNPRTIHIFDDCIIGSYKGVVRCSVLEKENGFLSERPNFPSESFLSFCHACRRNLGHGKDIFMYRGEKAFCSRECRYQEMLREEEMEKSESDMCL